MAIAPLQPVPRPIPFGAPGMLPPTVQLGGAAANQAAAELARAQQVAARWGGSAANGWRVGPGFAADGMPSGAVQAAAPRGPVGLNMQPGRLSYGPPAPGAPGSPPLSTLNLQPQRVVAGPPVPRGLHPGISLQPQRLSYGPPTPTTSIARPAGYRPGGSRTAPVNLARPGGYAAGRAITPGAQALSNTFANSGSLWSRVPGAAGRVGAAQAAGGRAGAGFMAGVAPGAFRSALGRGSLWGGAAMLADDMVLDRMGTGGDIAGDALMGAAIGGSIGSVVPVVGTGLGAGVGALVGAGTNLFGGGGGGGIDDMDIAEADNEAMSNVTSALSGAGIGFDHPLAQTIEQSVALQLASIDGRADNANEQRQAIVQNALAQANEMLLYQQQMEFERENALALQASILMNTRPFYDQQLAVANAEASSLRNFAQQPWVRPEQAQLLNTYADQRAASGQRVASAYQQQALLAPQYNALQAQQDFDQRLQSAQIGQQISQMVNPASQSTDLLAANGY